MKYILPKNTAQLNNIISEAIIAAATMKEKVQIAAVAVLHHAYLHGDYTKANDLVDGLGHGVKRDSLVAYFVELGGLTVSEGATGFDGWKGKEHIKANFEQAKATMWYDFKKANPFTGYSLEDELRKVMKRHVATLKKAEGMSDEDKAKVDATVSDETIKQLLGLVNFEVITDDELSVDEQLAEALKVA